MEPLGRSHQEPQEAERRLPVRPESLGEVLMTLFERIDAELIPGVERDESSYDVLMGLDH